MYQQSINSALAGLLTQNLTNYAAMAAGGVVDSRNRRFVVDDLIFSRPYNSPQHINTSW